MMKSHITMMKEFTNQGICCVFSQIQCFPFGYFLDFIVKA